MTGLTALIMYERYIPVMSTEELYNIYNNSAEVTPMMIVRWEREMSKSIGEISREKIRAAYAKQR